MKRRGSLVVTQAGSTRIPAQRANAAGNTSPYVFANAQNRRQVIGLSCYFFSFQAYRTAAPDVRFGKYLSDSTYMAAAITWTDTIRSGPASTRQTDRACHRHTSGRPPLDRPRLIGPRLIDSRLIDPCGNGTHADGPECGAGVGRRAGKRA